MARGTIAALSMSSLLIGCAQNSLRYASTSTSPIPAVEREASVVHVRPGRCSEPPSAGVVGAVPIVAALIGVAADFAVSAGSAWLRHQRDGRNATWVATGAGSALQPTTVAQSFCLTIARGVLTEGPGSNENFRPFDFRDEPAFFLRVDLTMEARSAAAGGGANAAPVAVALTARPYELRYAETAARVRGSARKNVSVVIAFSPQTLQPAAGAAATPDTAKATVIRLDFGRLDVGRVYRQALLSDVNGVASFPAAGHTMMTAVVSESENASVALDAIISAVDDNSDDLSDALRSTIEQAVGASDDD
jgi:hypothetical protein